MALLRAGGLCRLALRTPFAAARLLSSVGAGGEPPSGVESRRRVELGALRLERALQPPAELAPAPRSYDAPRATDEQLLLNKAIQACLTAETLLGLVTQATLKPILNEVNVATALLAVAKHVRKADTAWLRGDARFAQLMQVAESLLGRMGARELSNALYACGKLGIAPPATWLRAYWDASGSKLGDFNTQAFSNTLYACGQLRAKPPADWLLRFWEASALKLGEFHSQAMSNVLYACALLRIKPPAEWLLLYWSASELKLGEFTPQALSNTVYACGQLGIRPPADWRQRFWQASSSKLGESNTQSLSNTLYACGQLDIAPPADWLLRFWDVSSEKLPQFYSQAYSNTLYACAQLRTPPPADWLLLYWTTSAPKLGEFNPQAFSNTLYACGQLRVTPSQEWWNCFWRASLPELDRFETQALSNTISACGQLGVTPPADWLQAFSRACELSLPNLRPQALSNTTLALATLALWDLPLLPGLWERLCRALPLSVAGWGASERLQAMHLYQAYTAAEVERPGLLAPPSPELLAAARKSWVDGLDADTAKTSKLHAAVSACLARMGVAHANERWCERAERRIDIAIEGAGAPVAVEVDGPHHFLQDGRQDGSTLLRNRMLAAHGWRVVAVDYRAWNEMKTPAQHEEHLRRLLA